MHLQKLSAAWGYLVEDGETDIWKQASLSVRKQNSSAKK